MARSVLRGRPDVEGHELVCHPQNEAAIYEEEFTLNLWRNACEFGGPVKLIGCDPNVPGAATGIANRALSVEGGYDYDFVEGTGHLLQIEKPQECLLITLKFLTNAITFKWIVCNGSRMSERQKHCYWRRLNGLSGRAVFDLLADLCRASKPGSRLKMGNYFAAESK